jgi:Carboxypeptidase regulatory-like domain
MRNKLLIFSTLLILVSANAFGQSGGTFAITESVIAGGGGLNAAGGTFSIDGTIGQTAAGNQISGFPFKITSGFWNFTPLAPTAANAAINGRVTTAGGRPIRNVSLRISGGALTEPKLARTNQFGYYRFQDLEVGQIYIVSIAAKRYSFATPNRVIVLNENLVGEDFVSDDK